MFKVLVLLCTIANLHGFEPCKTNLETICLCDRVSKTVLCTRKHLENFQEILFQEQWNVLIEVFHLEDNLFQHFPDDSFWKNFPQLREVYLNENPICGTYHVENIHFELDMCDITTSTTVSTISMATIFPSAKTAQKRFSKYFFKNLGTCH